MRKAEEDYMGLSRGASLPATSTPSAQRKVGPGRIFYSLISCIQLACLGWTPSTFVSSRSDRAKSRTARPEDFMDEEDLSELRADQNLVSEHDEMDILGGTQAERARKTGVDDSQKECVPLRLACVSANVCHVSSITLALEQAMLPAPKDSVGGRILKKMGWRPGLGIGPRVTWRQREIQHGRDPDRVGPDVDEEAKKHTYAPKDTPMVIVPRKDAFHGLGHTRTLGLHASLGIHEQDTQGSQGPRLAGIDYS